jgi:predicted ArsR family transcriptional regulator
MELLRDWGSASAEELARVLAIHPGNVRKYLAILSAEGRAQRRSDGQWVLTTAEVSLAS